MKSFDYVITDEIGIHARPAGNLAKEVKQFGSVVRVHCGQKEADARKLMAVMGLGIKHGDLVTVTVDGADEDAAFPAIEKFFQENL